MDPKLLPKDLQPDQQLRVSEADYPIKQTNPITGYRISLYRYGKDAEDIGWIQLVNGDQAAGYIYIRRTLSSPYLGSTRYVVMDLTPDLLDPVLRILQSVVPLQIRFFQASANGNAIAFLQHRE